MTSSAPSFPRPTTFPGLRNIAQAGVVCPAPCFLAPARSARLWRESAALEGCLAPQAVSLGLSTSISWGSIGSCSTDWLDRRLGGEVRGVSHASHPLQRTQRQASSLPTTRQAPPAAVARCRPVHPRSNSIVAPLTGGPREVLFEGSPSKQYRPNPIFILPNSSSPAAVLVATPSSAPLPSITLAGLFIGPLLLWPLPAVVAGYDW
jgi:hypothetical protein